MRPNKNKRSKRSKKYNRINKDKKSTINRIINRIILRGGRIKFSQKKGKTNRKNNSKNNKLNKCLRNYIKRQNTKYSNRKGGARKTRKLRKRINKNKRKKHKNIKPMTVYRSLKNLQRMGLVHKSNQSKIFFICNSEARAKHNLALAVCKKCKKTEEINFSSLS